MDREAQSPNVARRGLDNVGYVAERVGFEPTVHRSAQRFSRPSDSTTLAPLRIFYKNLVALSSISSPIAKSGEFIKM